MSYKISAKNRKIKKLIQIILNIISLWWRNFPNYNKMIFFWVIIWILSLFLDWFNWEKISWNSFNSILWLTWIILFIIYIKIISLLFLWDKIEKIKFIFKINVKNSILIIFLWAFWFWITINTIFIIKNFSFFDSDMMIWIKWVWLNLVWFIFIIIWGFLSNNSKKEVFVYTDNIQKDEVLDEIIQKETNMKLPF